MAFLVFLVSLLGAASLILIIELIKPYVLARLQKTASLQDDKKPLRTASAGTKPEDAYSNIEALLSFNWRTTSPINIRPFKPKYHLTMALETITMNDLIPVDNTYLERIQLRRQLMQEHRAATLSTRPGSEAMIYELYEWMFTTYLPKRFPSMYTLDISEKAPSSHHLHNNVTNEDIPLQPPSPETALHTLGAHIDTDFLFLQPSAEDQKYHLEAFIGCFPAGFSTREKLGLPLAAIHIPVPGYSAKLEKSMDRFFANLPVGKIVKRSNWSITTDDHLFSESGNHLYDDKAESAGSSGGDGGSVDVNVVADKESKNEKTLDVSSPSLETEIARQREEVRIEDCRLRCERQTLFRLPKTGALVFAFKTYMYTLKQVKDEGSGEDLAAAIQGLGEGNVPEMKFYKRGVVWGDKVVEYLQN